MKIIPKYAGGGNVSSFFTVYQATPNPQIGGTPTSTKTSDSKSDSVTVKDSSKSSKSESDDTKGKLTEKDLFNMVKDVDGLENERSKIIASLKHTLEMQNLTGASASDISNTYLTVLNKIKTAKDNKERYKEALQDAKTNGSLGEVAISLNGGVYVQNAKGNVLEMSLETYQANKDKYSLLTNGNLAYLRKYDPRTAFTKNDNVFETISNGVGFESFQKLLDTAKSNLGSYKYEEQGLAGKEALAGLKALQGKSNEEKQKLVDSVTGNTVKYTTTQDSNVQNVKSLITYLSAMLPKRARVWAAIKTGKSEDEAVATLVGAYLTSGIKQTDSLKIDIPSESKKKGKSGSGDSSDMDKMEMNTPMKFLDGEGVSGTYVLNPGTSRAVQVVSNTMPLTNAEGKPVGTNATLQDAVNGEYAGILDMNHATIGGHTLDSSAYGSIILKDGKISSIDYPCTIKDNGEIVPNTSPKIIKAKQDAEQLLRSKGVDVRKPEHIKKYWRAINAAYKKYGLSDAYNDQGEPTGSWRRFGVVNVTASDKALGMGDMDDNPLLKEVTNDSVIDNLVQITKDDKFNKKGFFNSLAGNYNRFYEGTLWIPLDVNYQAAAISTKTTMGQTRALEEAQQARDVRANWKPAHQI